MTQRLCRWVLYSLLGWKKAISEEHPAKYIICLAPHTSNWDFLIGQLYMHAEGLHVNFLMKKEWFVWPLGPLARKMGGIPVYRSKKMKMTEQLAAEALHRDNFVLAITPEGTRSLNADWKRGFYFIAQGAGIPILLYGLDYKRRLIECRETVVPSGDVDADMKHIKCYFKDYKGKHPENFTIGEA